MSYKCEICGQPQSGMLRRHTVYKTVVVLGKPQQQIDREIPVCSDCLTGFKSGYTLEQMQRICGPKTDTIIPKALSHLYRVTNTTGAK